MQQEKMINSGQMRAIYGLAKRCGLDGDTLHDLVECQTRRTSVKALTVRQASMVIDRLKALLGEAPGDQDTPVDRATNAQQRKIYALARGMGWMDDPKRLRCFLEKRFGYSDVKFLPAAKVSAVIEALKAIQDGGRGERPMRGGEERNA